MAGEHTESEAHGEGSSNGVSKGAGGTADIRAAFLAGELGNDGAEPSGPGKAEKPTKAEPDDEDDKADGDLDEDDSADEVEGDAEVGDEEDDVDSDLDDEDEDEDKDEEKGDAETQKRISQVRRADKRLREQRDKDFAARERAINEKVVAIEAEWKPRVEAAERFERAAARINVDIVPVLQSLGLKPERFEHAAQVLYTLSKGKDDPKAQTAVAQLVKERERDDEIERLRKKDEDRDNREKQREQEAIADRQLDSYFGKVTKAASDKTPLARAYIKANPTESRERMQVIAFRIAKESGSDRLPAERAVIVALERDRRRVLREVGIDPKSHGAAAASASATDPKTTTSKKNDKKKADEKPAVKTDGKKLDPRDEFLRSKYD